MLNKILKWLGYIFLFLTLTAAIAVITLVLSSSRYFGGDGVKDSWKYYLPIPDTDYETSKSTASSSTLKVFEIMEDGKKTTLNEIFLRKSKTSFLCTAETFLKDGSSSIVLKTFVAKKDKVIQTYFKSAVKESRKIKDVFVPVKIGATVPGLGKVTEINKPFTAKAGEFSDCITVEDSNEGATSKAVFCREVGLVFKETKLPESIGGTHTIQTFLKLQKGYAPVAKAPKGAD